MIYVVGIGLDGVESLSKKVLEIISQATIIIGSKRHLSYFLNHCAKAIELSNLEEIIRDIKKYLKTDNFIVILVSGDPLFFGLGRFLLANFLPEQLEFFPQISSIQLAFNRVKISWQDVKIVSIHGRDFTELISCLQTGSEKIAVLTDNIHNPLSILNLYKSLNIPVIYDFWVCENLGGDEEKISYFAEGKNLENNSFASLNIVILIKKKSPIKTNLDLEKLPLFGLDDSLFFSFPDRSGLMTKREIRLIILGELNLQPNQVIWDIGAGTGSVSIEIARLCPSSHILAIEKTAIGITLIKKNCDLFDVKNITVIQEKAPQNLDKLPLPNRIFIGGSAGNLAEILKVCQEKLITNGKIIIALATLENMQESINFFKENGWEYNLLQVQISKSIPIANLTRFNPLNPVTIISAKKDFNLKKV